MRSFPFNAAYEANGDVSVTWLTYDGVTDVAGTTERLRFAPTDLLTVDNRVTGSIDIMSAVEVKEFADQCELSANITELNVIALVSGLGKFASAETLTARAGIAAFEIALPAANQYLTEHAEEIAALPGGPALLTAWRVFNLAVAAYGVVQLVQSGAQIISNLRNAADDLVTANPASSVARTARERTGELVEITEHPEFQMAGTHSPSPTVPQARAVSGSHALDPDFQPEVIPEVRQNVLPFPTAEPTPNVAAQPSTPAASGPAIGPAAAASALAAAAQNTGSQSKRPCCCEVLGPPRIEFVGRIIPQNEGDMHMGHWFRVHIDLRNRPAQEGETGGECTYAWKEGMKSEMKSSDGDTASDMEGWRKRTKAAADPNCDWSGTVTDQDMPAIYLVTDEFRALHFEVSVTSGCGDSRPYTIKGVQVLNTEEHSPPQAVRKPQWVDRGGTQKSFLEFNGQRLDAEPYSGPYYPSSVTKNRLSDLGSLGDE
jgi:hypothetical protein